MNARYARAVWLAVFATAGCGLSSDRPVHGEGTIVGYVDGMDIATNDGVAIARSFPPLTQVKVSPGGVECQFVLAGDRVTIDLGDSRTGYYTVVRGYPPASSLTRDQARAHVCPAKGGDDAGRCHDQVRSGAVTIRRFDRDRGGRIEGEYRITLADGELSGEFSALRCD